jgi:hypothetical protein
MPTKSPKGHFEDSSGVAPKRLEGRQWETASANEAPSHWRSTKKTLKPSAPCSVDIRAAATWTSGSSPSISIRKRYAQHKSCKGHTFARGWNWRISVFVKAQQTAPTAAGTNSHPIAAFSGKRIQEPVISVFGLRCSTFLARGSHKKRLTG